MAEGEASNAIFGSSVSDEGTGGGKAPESQEMPGQAVDAEATAEGAEDGSEATVSNEDQLNAVFGSEEETPDPDNDLESQPRSVQKRINYKNDVIKERDAKITALEQRLADRGSGEVDFTGLYDGTQQEQFQAFREDVKILEGMVELKDTKLVQDLVKELKDRGKFGMSEDAGIKMTGKEDKKKSAQQPATSVDPAILSMASDSVVSLLKELDVVPDLHRQISRGVVEALSEDGGRDFSRDAIVGAVADLFKEEGYTEAFVRGKKARKAKPKLKGGVPSKDAAGIETPEAKPPEEKASKPLTSEEAAIARRKKLTDLVSQIDKGEGLNL